ncbi:tol-pal system protein YbgF [Microvirga pudoricolor]|uniref:tol-pal system protein YbgF n=1 Tax=Microvirga pudoricolor TaxID=2778729 RepID=UPI00194E64F2|nr:tol-pal system protein YbgF [Microvirga pudoricolor]MBM6593049.1 tol-pal system protein YbgF [Microvirga pudoricolor]
MFRRSLAALIAALALASISVPALAQDAADAIVRLSRLESQIRQLSGQMEQLQFENRQLKDQLRRFQEDVEYRFQENRGGSRPSAPPTATPARPAQPQPQKRSDAFDPGTEPEAPGAPRQLGSAAPSAPLDTSEIGRPMALPGGRLAGIGDLIEGDDAPPGSAPLDIGGTGRTASVAPARPGPSVAATSSGDPRSDFDAAYASYTQRQYEQAEMGFRRFLQSNPRDRMVPEASYWLGESYLQRGRHREAAEQFLNVSADYPSSAKAPDALLKLGVSLNAIGARDRACAVFVELDRKYPQASASVRQGSAREQQRAKCS